MKGAITKQVIVNLRKAINAEKETIAKARDRLRDLLDDAEAVMESSQEGVELLEAAVEKLSEYV